MKYTAIIEEFKLTSDETILRNQLVALDVTDIRIDGLLIALENQNYKHSGEIDNIIDRFHMEIENCN
jgi:hypothetical protein